MRVKNSTAAPKVIHVVDKALVAMLLKAGATRKLPTLAVTQLAAFALREWCEKQMEAVQA